MQLECLTARVPWTDEELADVRRARLLLEQPSLASRLTQALGRPIEEIFHHLPFGLGNTLHQVSGTALRIATRMATWTLLNRSGKPSSEFLHRGSVMVTGGIGGSLGLATLVLELPVSTTLMLRSIADIARSEGLSLRDPMTRMACLEVFAHEGGNPALTDPNKHYWAVRLALAKAVSEAAAYAAGTRVGTSAAPVITRLVSGIASRYGVIVSQQVAAKAVPLIGAATGMAINLIFIRHFQTIARGHFIIKRLERKYGMAQVRDLYGSVALPDRQ